MPSPYEYKFHDPSGTYQFTTKNKIVYRIAFVEDYILDSISPSGYEFGNVYQVVVEKITNGIEPLDSRVARTIERIISEFFSNQENAMIYVCSDNEGKEALRFATFTRWFDKSPTKAN